MTQEEVYTGVYQYVNGELTTIIEDGYLSINDLKDKLHALNQEYVFIGFNLENIKHLLDSEVIESLPKASVMKSLIQQPENIHSFTPKYHKLSEEKKLVRPTEEQLNIRKMSVEDVPQVFDIERESFNDSSWTIDAFIMK